MDLYESLKKGISEEALREATLEEFQTKLATARARLAMEQEKAKKQKEEELKRKTAEDNLRRAIKEYGAAFNIAFENENTISNLIKSLSDGSLTKFLFKWDDNDGNDIILNFIKNL